MGAVLWRLEYAEEPGKRTCILQLNCRLHPRLRNNPTGALETNFSTKRMWPLRLPRHQAAVKTPAPRLCTTGIYTSSPWECTKRRRNCEEKVRQKHMRGGDPTRWCTGVHRKPGEKLGSVPTIDPPQIIYNRHGASPLSLLYNSTLDHTATCTQDPGWCGTNN